MGQASRVGRVRQANESQGGGKAAAAAQQRQDSNSEESAVPPSRLPAPGATAAAVAAARVLPPDQLIQLPLLTLEEVLVHLPPVLLGNQHGAD